MSTSWAKKAFLTIFNILKLESFFLIGSGLLLFAWYQQTFDIKSRQKALDDYKSQREEFENNLLHARLALMHKDFIFQSSTSTKYDSIRASALYINCVANSYNSLLKLPADSIDNIETNVRYRFTLTEIQRHAESESISSLLSLQKIVDSLFSTKLNNVQSMAERYKKKVQKDFNSKSDTNFIFFILGSALIWIDKVYKYFIKQTTSPQTS